MEPQRRRARRDHLGRRAAGQANGALPAPHRESQTGLAVTLGVSRGVRGVFLRNARGEIRATSQKQAIEAAKAAAADLRIGPDPFGSSRMQTAPQKDTKRPTIKTAFDEALCGNRGIFVAHSKHKRDWLCVSEYVLAALRTGPGPDDFPLVDEIVPGTAETVWRHLLDQATHPKHLYRTAHKAVTCLYGMIRWLHDRQPSRYPDRRAMGGWQAALRRDWETKFKTKIDPEEDDQPRYDEREMQLAFERLDEADLPVAVMAEVAPDQRAGQVVRATRRDLDMSAGAGGLGCGTLNLLRHARDRKNTAHLDLSRQARERLLQAMSPGGYLHELETAYQRHLRGEPDGLED